MALSLVLWRTVQLEARTWDAEIERAELVAERILQRAPHLPSVMDLVPADCQGLVRGEGVEVEPAVAWLHAAPSAADADPVVDDRLERAARAEFGAKDQITAQREFDELLAAPLPGAQRLQVLTAACWHATRIAATERLQQLRQELDERLKTVIPAELGRPGLASTVAAAMRLPREGGAPAWVERLVPSLPEGALAGLLGAQAWSAAQTPVLARRAFLQGLDEAWRRRPVPTPQGLVALGNGELLWWLPREDGATSVARMPVAQWLAAVAAAGRTGHLAEWPWLVAADVVADPTVALAGVPYLRGVRPVAESSFGQRPWLLPSLTFGLLVAFGLAVWLQFRASRREAAAVRAQAEFLTTVTHELKTPLASIRLLGEMLVEGRARGREAEYYRMLAGEAGRLSMLIENVLDLGRVERGERAYDLRPLDVGEVVRETVDLLAPQGFGVTFVGALEPVPARLDRSALVQALISVLDNARKYGQAPIEVAVTTRGGTIAQISVRDRGPGVPEAERERIFDRFVRGAAHAHGSTPGVGIGLYLARTIARRLGGDLVCGVPVDGGPGALFTFTLPMETTA